MGTRLLTDEQGAPRDAERPGWFGIDRLITVRGNGGSGKSAVAAGVRAVRRRFVRRPLPTASTHRTIFEQCKGPTFTSCPPS